MSVMDMNSRMAMAEKLSVQQLQQAIQSGSLPAYIGIPLIEQKTKEKAQMAAAQQGQEKPPSVAASILQKAEQQEQQPPGIDQLPSNLPIQNEEDEENYAGGGIVAFSGKDGSAVKFNEENSDPLLERLSRDDPNAFQRLMRSFFPGFDPRDQGSSSSTVFSPSVKDVPFTTGPQTQGGALLPFRRPRGASNAPTPDLSTREEELLPTQDLSLLDSPAPDTAASPTRGSLTAGISPADVARTEAQLPRTGTPSPKAPPSTGKVANIPLTTGEMRSDVAAGSGSMLDQYAAMLMDERKGIAKDRQQAKAMAIFQAGLGIAGGTSPNPFANISQGALQGTQAYQQEMKGIRREDADRLKQLMSLGIGKEKLALEARKLGIEDKKIEGLLARYAAAGAGSEDAIITRRLNTAKSLFSDAMKANPFADEATQDAMWANAQRRAMIPGAGTSAEEPKNKRIDFGALK